MFNTDSGVSIFGSTIMQSESFPRKTFVEESLGKDHQHYIHIVNILEVTEKDYEQWFKE